MHCPSSGCVCWKSDRLECTWGNLFSCPFCHSCPFDRLDRAHPSLTQCPAEVRKMLAVLLIAGALIPQTHAQDFPLALLSTESQIISSRFFNSLLLTLPPCNYGGKNVDIQYQNLNINTNYYLSNIFTIPSCTNTGYPYGLTALSRRIGYQLMNLNESTQYTITYKIGNISSTPLTASTRTAANYTDIDLSFAGRSAAMVVITAILSVTMFILLLSIIISSFVSPKGG